MGVLLMRLAGPMQSWGTQSRFTVRDSGSEPSKSGVVGLLCAACGIKRDDISRIAELASLKMGVRVDREGVRMADFQTAGGGTWPGRKVYGVWKSSGTAGDTVTSTRHYLADADFLVALEGPEELLCGLDEALARPVWPLYLGRKGYVPGIPVRIPDGLREGDAESALRSYPWRRRFEKEKVPARLRLVLESNPRDGQPRADVPVSFDSADRKFKVRYVKVEWMDTSNLPVADWGVRPCLFTFLD